MLQKKKIIFFFSKVQWNSWLMPWADWNEWLMSQSSLTMPKIVLITCHFSNSAKFRGMLQFRGKWQILWLGSKFCGPRKTEGPTDENANLVGQTRELLKWLWKNLHNTTTTEQFWQYSLLLLTKSLLRCGHMEFETEQHFSINMKISVSVGPWDNTSSSRCLSDNDLLLQWFITVELVAVWYSARLPMSSVNEYQWRLGSKQAYHNKMHYCGTAGLASVWLRTNKTEINVALLAHKANTNKRQVITIIVRLWEINTHCSRRVTRPETTDVVVRHKQNQAADCHRIP